MNEPAGSAGKALQRYGLEATWRAKPGTVNPAPNTIEWRKPQKGPGKPQVLFALGAAREIPRRGKAPVTPSGRAFNFVASAR